jgi:hypothetical protein
MPPEIRRLMDKLLARPVAPEPRAISTRELTETPIGKARRDWWREGWAYGVQAVAEQLEAALLALPGGLPPLEKGAERQFPLPTKAEMTSHEDWEPPTALLSVPALEAFALVPDAPADLPPGEAPPQDDIQQLFRDLGIALEFVREFGEWDGKPTDEIMRQSERARKWLHSAAPAPPPSAEGWHPTKDDETTDQARTGDDGQRDG